MSTAQRSETPLAGEAAAMSALRPPLRERLWWGVCAALLLVTFAPTLIELVAEWIERPEYSHGFLMLPIAIWMVRDRWELVRQAPRRRSLLGVAVLVFGLMLLMLGEMKLSWFLKPWAFVICVAGLVWSLAGWQVLKAVLPAFLPLLLMCPLPGRVERALTLPLKQHAAVLATGLLDLSGVAATLDGNLIHLPGIDSLWIADACSGIRSLISLVSIALLACVYWNRSIPLKLGVLAACVPIAVLVNGLRIWVTGVLSVRIGPEAAQGFFHFFEGFVLFAVAAVMLLAWAWLLNAIRGTPNAVSGTPNAVSGTPNAVSGTPGEVR
ncbi:MAG: exosortase/archaeosortase family protein [Planctomycetota bacterium]